MQQATIQPFLPEPDQIEQLAEKHGTPLFLLSTKTAVRQIKQMEEGLPRASVHYAMKANEHEMLIKALASAGCSFEIASRGELELLRKEKVPADKIMYTNPIKDPADIKYALETGGVKLMVVDNENEVEKMVPYKDSVQLLVRLKFIAKEARIQLSKKFGAEAPEVFRIMQYAASKGLHVRGMSFHCGTQMTNPEEFAKALEECRRMFDSSKLKLDVLDIGGGFPAAYTKDPKRPFEQESVDMHNYFKIVHRAMVDLFDVGTEQEAAEREKKYEAENRGRAQTDEPTQPTDEGKKGSSKPRVEIITEPGRFVAAPAMCLITKVIGKERRSGMDWLFINDGVYGGYSGIMSDDEVYCIYPVKTLHKGAKQGPTFKTVIAGPTCDSADLVYQGIEFPECDIGELLVSPMIGAYSSVTATEFNLFPKPKIVVVD